MNAVSPKRTDAAAAYRNAPRHELREFQPICTTDTPVACQFGSAIFANLTHEDGVNIGMASGTQLMARRLLTEVMTMGTASDAEVGAARVHPFADDICTLDDDTFLLRASFVEADSVRWTLLGTDGVVRRQLRVSAHTALVHPASRYCEYFSRMQSTTARPFDPDPSLVVSKATLVAAERLGLTNRHLAVMLGVSDASVSRMRHGRGVDPDSKEGELALLFVRLFRSLDTHVCGDDSKSRAWMHAMNTHVRSVPAERIRTVEGLVDVVQYLDAMRGRH